MALFRQQNTPNSRPQERRQAGGGKPSFIDPHTLMRIKNLQLRAKAVVEGFYSGLHRSPYHGFSVEFSEYRQYTPGEDPRYLDWKVYARSDRYYIKRFEDETNLRCYLLVDMSRSMDYGSVSFTKADYARTAAATLTYFLSMQRDAVGLLTFDEKIAQYIPARYRPGHMHQLMLALEKPPGGKATDLSAPLEQIARTVTRRGMIILFSDFLAPIETLKLNLGSLRSCGHEVILLRILDPSEETFSFSSPAVFYDVESGRNVYVDPDSARKQYQKRFAAHTAAIQDMCSGFGIDFFTMTVERPLEFTLFDFLNARLRRGKQIARRGYTYFRGHV